MTIQDAKTQSKCKKFPVAPGKLYDLVLTTFIKVNISQSIDELPKFQ